MRALLLLGAVLLTFMLAGCAHQRNDGGRYYDQGPPPHAPAHGYRAKHRQHNMVYDSRVGAYVVSGYRDYYYLKDRYYRYRDGDWSFNDDIDGRNWDHIDYDQVPYKLRNSKSTKSPDYDDHRGKAKGKDKGKGKGKDKDRY